jgi:hypothetical protein
MLAQFIQMLAELLIGRLGKRFTTGQVIYECGG